MKRFRIEVPAKINGGETIKQVIGDGLDGVTIVLSGKILIFHNGPSRSFTVIDDFFPIPPELAEMGRIRHSSDISFSYELGLTTFDFFSAKMIMTRADGYGKILTEKEKAINRAKAHIEEALQIGDIIIKDGILIRGNGEELKKHGMKLFLK